jgi:phospholipase C
VVLPRQSWHIRTVPHTQTLRLTVPLLILGALGCSSSSSGGDQPDATPPVDSGDTGVDAPIIGCSRLPDDPKRSDRQACTFAAGAKVTDTLGAGAADKARAKISRVVVLMKENRAFDHMFGQLPKNGHPDVEGTPADFSNLDLTGAKVVPFHQTNTCVPTDPTHQWQNMHDMSNGGKMDGFVKNAANTSTIDDKPVASDGHFVLGYYDATELPFYYWLAGQWTLADHYFGSALSGTWANRLYLLCGTSYGVKDTSKDSVKADAKTVLDGLDAAGVTYGVYTDEIPFDFALFTAGWNGSHKGVHKAAQFLDDAKNGTLPQVSFVDSLMNVEDEHPPADVQVGEAWTRATYDALTKSPNWLDKDGKGMAVFYTYDESGGFFDHVPPPKSCAASPDQAEFDTLGVRVPMMLISPYSRPKYVSHLEHQHTSITRFIELLFDLPALTARDANSDALLDMFDFECPAIATPPAPPAAGTGGCKK